MALSDCENACTDMDPPTHAHCHSSFHALGPSQARHMRAKRFRSGRQAASACLASGTWAVFRQPRLLGRVVPTRPGMTPDPLSSPPGYGRPAPRREGGMGSRRLCYPAGAHQGAHSLLSTVRTRAAWGWGGGRGSASVREELLPLPHCRSPLRNQEATQRDNGGRRRRHRKQ